MADQNSSWPRRQLGSAPGNGAIDGVTFAGTFEVPGQNGVRHYARLLRRYVWLGLALIVAGAAAGVATVVLSSPMYKVRTMLEVQGINEAWLRNSFEVATSYDSNQVNIQTQITLLKSGPFLQRVYSRLQAETVPPPPEQVDFFSRIRRRMRNDIQDPIQIMKDGLQSAFESFDARPINGTRLIEISCDSSNPQMASQFINTMASEFLEETMRSRSQTSQKTSEWLSSQIEENKIKLQDAEQRLQEFVLHSGNVFAARDGTLDDAKLKQLQSELAVIQADRIAKQTHYELAGKSTPDTLPQILDDEVLRGYQAQIADLQRQKAALETTLMPKNPKVAKIDAQLATVQANFQAEVNSVIGRIRNEYESAVNRERLLSAAYSTQLQRVSSIAGKSAEYNGLQREVETQRQMYQGLLVQANQSGVSSSVPVSPVRLVEVTSPPLAPYKPRPVLNISFGMIAGLFLMGGIAFLREKMDQSVQHPRSSQRLFSVPQLGVIPSLGALEDANVVTRLLRSAPRRLLNGRTQPDGREKTVTAWLGGPSFIAESFRATLASLLRDLVSDTKSRTIVVTSPGPEEGKTTIASNLAMALAESGRKVLLVDADFRRPTLHRVFGLPNERGFIDLLTEKRPLTDEAFGGVMTKTSVPGLTLLVNRVGENVSRLFYSPQLRNVLEHLRQGFDIVLLDTPPLLHLADTRLIAPLTDGVILVIRAGVTDRETALEACERLREDGLNLLGTVLNDWNPGSSHLKRHYYYDYSSKPER